MWLGHFDGAPCVYEVLYSACFNSTEYRTIIDEAKAYSERVKLKCIAVYTRIWQEC